MCRLAGGMPATRRLLRKSKKRCADSRHTQQTTTHGGNFCSRVALRKSKPRRAAINRHCGQSVGVELADMPKWGPKSSDEFTYLT